MLTTVDPDRPLALDAKAGSRWEEAEMAKKEFEGTPDWIRKAAIASVISDLLRDPDAYLTSEFGLQPMAEHVLDLADRLFAIATEGSEGQ